MYRRLPMPFEPIENYGVIGNMQSIALVGMNGSIDFLCYPNFDSPSIFAALLDDRKGGRFQLAPQLTNARVRQMYLPGTNILITRFLADQGVVELTDYMPIDSDGGDPNEIVRKVAVIRGDVRFQMCCEPRFSYATCGHRLELSEACATFYPFSNDCPPMSLHSTVGLGRRSDDVTADFQLKAGQTAMFLFGRVRAAGQDPEMQLLDQRFRNTAQYWKAWISKSKYKGRWREDGSTFGTGAQAADAGARLADRRGDICLPERIGGERNWDYRYTWLRDSAFAMYAMMRLGFIEEARAFSQWIRKRARDDEQGPLQVMYRVDGGQELDEIILAVSVGLQGLASCSHRQCGIPNSNSTFTAR